MRIRRILSAILAGACLLAGCSTDPLESRRSPSARSTAGLSQPYPYTTPTPQATPTAADGEYQRSVTDKEAGGLGPCRRCPPYRLEIGTSTLSLQAGVFRITNEVQEEGAIDWRSVGHYTVSDGQIVFFNDPNCPQTRGSYRWSLAGSHLTLDVIEDDCAFGGLRWRYLMAVPWSAASS